MKNKDEETKFLKQASNEIECKIKHVLERKKENKKAHVIMIENTRGWNLNMISVLKI